MADPVYIAVGYTLDMAITEDLGETKKILINLPVSMIDDLDHLALALGSKVRSAVIREALRVGIRSLQRSAEVNALLVNQQPTGTLSSRGTEKV